MLDEKMKERKRTRKSKKSRGNASSARARKNLRPGDNNGFSSHSSSSSPTKGTNKRRVEMVDAWAEYERNRQRMGFVLFGVMAMVSLYILNRDSEGRFRLGVLFGSNGMSGSGRWWFTSKSEEGSSLASRTKIQQFELVSPRDYQCTMLEEYSHNDQDFTQGWQVFRHPKVMNNELLLVESTGLYGKSMLYKWEYHDGYPHNRPLSETPLDSKLFGEGCAVYFNEQRHKFEIYVLTWKERQVLVFDFDSAKQLRVLDMPKEMDQGWGLHFDSDKHHQFIATDGSARVFFIEPKTFTVVKIIKVFDQQRREVKMLNDLTMLNGWIIANVWFKQYLVIISPVNGRVYGYIQCGKLIPLEVRNKREAVLNGVSFNPITKNLVVTGKLWPQYFEIETPSFLFDIAPPIH